MEHEPTLLYALKKLLERSSSEYWPVEQEIARWAIEIAEAQQHPESTCAHLNGGKTPLTQQDAAEGNRGKK